MISNLVRNILKNGPILQEAKRIDPVLTWTPEQDMYAFGDNSGGHLTERHLAAIEQARFNCTHNEGERDE